MRYTLYAQNIVLSPFSRRQLEEKVRRIGKYLKHPLPLEVAVKQEGRAGMFVCALTYGDGKHVLHAERGGETFEDSLDAALEAFRHELTKQRERQRLRV